MSRPERIAPPELFYDDKEAGKYTGNSRIIAIQTAMAERCIELLNFTDDGPKLILDIGCGSGLSGDVLSEAGHSWVGLDISPSMLEIAVARNVDGDCLQSDMGQGFGFRAGMFDGAISVSALQWLCYSDKRDHKSAKRLNTFFTSLYRCMRRGARAALQFYPESAGQLDLISQTAAACGFGGGLVVDFPNSTKAKKYFLCIYAGIDPAAKGGQALPKALGVRAAKGGAGAGSSGGMDGDDGDDDDADADDDDEVVRAYSRRRAGGGAAGGAGAGSSSSGGAGMDGAFERATAAFESRRERPKKRKGKSKLARVSVKSRTWIEGKKAKARGKGLKVKPTTKYTGRKRSGFKV